MVDRLLAWLRSLPPKFMNWWEKFTIRQKITIIGLSVAVIAAIIVLISVLAKPNYVVVYTAANESDAQEAIDLLKSNSIECFTDKEGLEISINEKDYTQAKLLLGSNSFFVDDWGIDNVTSGGFTTTEADKQKRYIVYLEKQFEHDLKFYDFVRTAHVTLNIPEDNGTLIAQNKEKSATVLLELNGDCSQDMAASIARSVATALGNESTNNVVILDTTGKMLFSGSDEASAVGTASSTFALQETVAGNVRNQVKQMLAATNEFSTIEVAANIVLDTSYTELSDHKYYVADGREEGYLVEEDIYESNSSGGVTGPPGTDSNTETGYDYEDTEYSNANVKEVAKKIVPSETTTLKQIPAGAIKYDDSSISVTLLTYNVLREQDAKSQGLLDGITWNEYKLANKDNRTKVSVDGDLYLAVSTATGIATKNITIIAYEEPYFLDKEGLDIETADVLQIILILLILGLLAFVIVRSMRAAKTEEEETEINIDEILQSTPLEELEEIGLEDKSEARKIVEKFVEDNPEAAANLLRNWLNEDWD